MSFLNRFGFGFFPVHDTDLFERKGQKENIIIDGRK